MNTFAFAVMVVPLQCLMALALALLVNAGLRAQTFFRAIYFSPVVTSMVVVSIVWTFLFDRDLGSINKLLSWLTLGAVEHVDWLGDPGTAMPAIAIMSAWKGAGFPMLIFLAGLQGISQELYNAARIDGATPWQRFWNVHSSWTAADRRLCARGHHHRCARAVHAGGRDDLGRTSECPFDGHVSRDPARRARREYRLRKHGGRRLFHSHCNADPRSAGVAATVGEMRLASGAHCITSVDDGTRRPKPGGSRPSFASPSLGRSFSLGVST